MSLDSQQLVPPYQLIYDSLCQGLVIPFFGAGASLTRNPTSADSTGERNAIVPTAMELAKFLASKSEFPSDEGLELTKVAQYYSLVGGRIPLYRELHSIFDRDFPLTPLHTFLANIPRPLLIITTNYDDLIERAYADQGKKFDVVIHTTDPNVGDRLIWMPHGSDKPVEVSPNKLDIDFENHTVIYKMHGTVDRRSTQHDQFVITEDDYVDFLVRMTKKKAVPAIFAEPFQSSHFLFLGYSLRDWNFRVILSRIQNELRRPTDVTSWSIQYKPSLMERKFWQRRGVEVYDILLNEFVQELNKRAQGAK